MARFSADIGNKGEMVRKKKYVLCDKCAKHGFIRPSACCPPQPKKPCWKCKRTGKVSKYFDAGDHFGSGTSPFSEWIDVACDECSD